MYFAVSGSTSWCLKCSALTCWLMLSMLVCAEGSDVLKAFTKFLALAKVGYNCAHKLYGEAQKKNDAHTIKFLECAIFEAVSGLPHTFVGPGLQCALHGYFCLILCGISCASCCSNQSLQPYTALPSSIQMDPCVICASPSDPQHADKVPPH